MPLPVTHITLSCPSASRDGLYHCRYPSGNAPVAQQLQGNASVVTSATGSLVPPPPTGVAATPGNNQNAITWTINSTYTSYNVLRSTTSGSGYTQIANVVTGPPSVTGFYEDSNGGGGLSNGTPYYYVVQGVTGTGAVSPSSTQVSATPAANALQPGPSGAGGTGALFPQTSPTGTNTSGITVTLGSTVYVRAAQVNTSTYAVTWLTSGGNLTGTSAAWSGIQSTSSGVNTTDFENFTVIDDQTVSFTLPPDAQSGQVYIGNGSNAGYAPNSLTVQYTAVPNVPTGLTAVADSAGSAVDLSWNNSYGAQSFKLYRSTTNGSGYTLIASPTTNSYADTGLTNGTPYYYVVAAHNNVGDSAQSSQSSATPQAPPTGNVTITANPGSTQSISPYIYGLNLLATSTASGGLPSIPYGNITLDRLGGNRFTAANWQNGWSSSGTDLNPVEIDQYLTTSATPLAMNTSLFDTDRTHGLACVMTVQLQGYVAAAQTGTLQLNSSQSAGPASSYPSLWKSVVYAKGSAFTTTPSNSNASVYMDEYVWATDQHYSGQGVFGTSPTTAPIHIELDNEPDAWPSTHPEVQTSTQITPATFKANSVSLAQAIRAQFPNAVIYGPVNASFASMYWWRGGSDYPSAGWSSSNFSWFFDDYIAAIKTASVSSSNPLVNGLCYHWYSQVPDPVTGAGIGGGSSSTSLTTAQIQTIAQGPRSFYDPNFIENSYITQDVTGAWTTTGSSISGTTLYVGTLNSGAIAVGHHVCGTSIAAGTTITGNISGSGSGSQWTVSTSQAVGSGPISGGPSTASINILPLINSKIANGGLGGYMRQCMTEWFMGGNQHVAGLLAAADSLGAFGANGVLSAAMWPNGASPAIFPIAAFSAFRNFDGSGSNFGETSVAASSSNLANVSCWVSTSTTHSGRVVMVIVNRSVAPQNVTVSGVTLTGTARLWQITASSAATQIGASQQIVPVSAGTQSASGTSITFAALPAYSVTTVDIY